MLRTPRSPHWWWRHRARPLPGQIPLDRGELLEGAPFSERDLRAPPSRCWQRATRCRSWCGPGTLTVTCTPITPSTWSAGTAASIPSRSPSTTSSPLSVPSTPPPVHQTFVGPTSSSVRSYRGPSTSTPARQGAVPPRQRGHRRGDLLCRGRLHELLGAGIGLGLISLHPAGFVQGPQPGSLERSDDAVAPRNSPSCSMPSVASA